MQNTIDFQCEHSQHFSWLTEHTYAAIHPGLSEAFKLKSTVSLSMQHLSWIYAMVNMVQYMCTVLAVRYQACVMTYE
jgi:hypothetical protein